MRACALLPVLALAGASAATAGDRLVLDGMIDVRAVHTDATPSFLYGGLGRLRFDDQHEGLRLGRAFAALRFRLTDTLTTNVLAEAYGDGDKYAVGLAEAWLGWRPYPRGPLRWQLKIGAFHLPVSLEHRLTGWTSPYTITGSALNSWIGEEFRVAGAELEARWLGASHNYRGSVALVAGVFVWNDPAGAIIAQRGWALSDRSSVLWSGLGRPRVDLYYEIDGRPGAYGGLSWRHSDRLEVRLLHYDNRADPGAHNASGDFAWDTRFSSAGVRWEPVDHFSFLAQRLDGITYVGANGSDDQFVMRLSAWYGLASTEFGRERFTARFDHFLTKQDHGFYGPPADDAGHAFTLAWMHRLAPGWELAAEWLRVRSTYPARTALGIAASVTERQLQIALRYRLRLEAGS